MLKPNESVVLTVLAAIALLLTVANMYLFSRNREAQADVASRAQYVQQSQQLEVLYREWVKALADLAMRSNDDALRGMLAKQGVTVAPKPGSSAPVAIPPAPVAPGASAPPGAPK